MADFNPDEFLASNPAQAPSPEAASAPEASAPGGFDPDAFLKDQQQEAYSTPGQKVGTAVEGALQGFAGPLGTALNRMFIDPRDTAARAEANPVSHGVGNAVGLGAGILTGTGEAALMEGAGKAAMEATGLTATKDIAEAGIAAGAKATAAGADAAGATQAAADAVKAAKGATSYAAKVGSETVKQAAEMAVLQGSDEVSKAMLDPNYSAESALGEIGMATALGAATGGVLQGVVSPLWSATHGLGMGTALDMIKNQLDSRSGKLSEGVEAAKNGLGLEVDPIMNATMSDNPVAQESAKDLKYSQNRQYADAEQNLRDQVRDKVTQASGISPDSIADYDKADYGQAGKASLIDEIKADYKPQQDAMNARDEFVKTVKPDDEAKLVGRDKIYENFLNEVKTSSPYFKEVNEWSDRFLDTDSLHEVDKLRTELGEQIRAASGGPTPNPTKANALRNIHKSMGDYIDDHINLSTWNTTDASAAIAARKMAAADYKQYASTMNDLMDHLGVGKFHGTGTFINKLENISPETFLNKISAKNNSEIIPFLEKNFPKTLENMRQAELRALMKPAVKNGQLDIAALAKRIENERSGNSSFVNFVVPQKFQDAIDHASTILDALPKIKDSGSPGGIKRIMSGMGSSALGMIGMMMGHNPVASAVMGHLAEKIGKDMPDAIRLAHLKFLGSDMPVSGNGFKAATDFLHTSMNGDKALIKGTKALFTAGKDVLSTTRIPDAKDREKLDKAVQNMQANPNKMVADTDNAHLGHYMPDHQTAATQATSNATQYLAQLKPHPTTLSPLQKPVPPSSQAIGRYNRALDIANNPHIVLQHIKDGQLQQSDIQDLKAMYPATYSRMQSLVSRQMLHAQSDGQIIPYKTRLSLSMFLGQPLDSTLQQPNILAAQLTHQPQQAQRQGQQGQAGKKPSAKAGTAMEKGANSYQTSSQSAESDRSNRS